MTLLKKHDAAVILRFGFSIAEAAEAVGVSANTFSTMVEDGRMPRPKCIGSRKVWDVEEVHAAFKALPHDKQVNDEGIDTWADLGA